jgi:hypothetical protein
LDDDFFLVSASESEPESDESESEELDDEELSLSEPDDDEEEDEDELSLSLSELDDDDEDEELSESESESESDDELSLSDDDESSLSEPPLRFFDFLLIFFFLSPSPSRLACAPVAESFCCSSSACMASHSSGGSIGSLVRTVPLRSSLVRDGRLAYTRCPRHWYVQCPNSRQFWHLVFEASGSLRADKEKGAVSEFQ